jgi:hypothetical protein
MREKSPEMNKAVSAGVSINTGDIPMQILRTMIGRENTNSVCHPAKSADNRSVLYLFSIS